MTPLNQQLEEKKKGCGRKFNLNPFGYVCGTLLKQWTPDNTGKEEVDLCPTCQAEIAILKQAIAEKNEFIELFKEEYIKHDDAKAFSYLTRENVFYIIDKVKNIQSPVSKDERLGGNKDKSTKPKEVGDNIESKISQDTQKLLQKQRQEILERIYFILKDIKCNSHQFISETEECFDREWEEMLEQLNQPKTEDEK